MNLAHELPAIGDVDELPEPETGVRIKKHDGRCATAPLPCKANGAVSGCDPGPTSHSTKAHRTRWQNPRRPSEFGRTYAPAAKPFVPDWALDRSKLPKKPPGSKP